MGAQHLIRELYKVVLPTGRNLSNGAFIRHRGEDSFEQLARLVNELKAYWKPQILCTPYKVTPPWTDNGGSPSVASFRFPGWPEGRQDATIIATYYVTTTGAGNHSVQVYIADQDGNLASDTVIDTFTGSLSGSERIIQITGVRADKEILQADLYITNSSNGDVGVHNLRLEWAADSVNLPDGPYGGEMANSLLPQDVEYWRQRYQFASVERVQRLLLAAWELLRRHTPQPIFCWGNSQDVYTLDGTSNTVEPSVRVLTQQLPWLAQVEVHIKARIPSFVDFYVGDFRTRVTGSDANGVRPWRRVLINTNLLALNVTQMKEFRIVHDRTTELEIESVNAFWRMPV